MPAHAVTWSRNGAAVWSVANGVAQQVPVVIRHRANDRVWLEGDLIDGQQLVIEGTQKLRDGSKVVDIDAARPTHRPASAKGNS